ATQSASTRLRSARRNYGWCGARDTPLRPGRHRRSTSAALSISLRNIRKTREKNAPLDYFENEDDAVVFVGAAAGEQIHFGEDGLHDLRSGQRALATDQVHQPLLAIFIVRGIHRFRDPIGAADKYIAWLHADVATVVVLAGEKSDHHPSLAQIIHGAIR